MSDNIDRESEQFELAKVYLNSVWYKQQELIDEIRKHRETRYGDPPKGPFFSADKNLYDKAGI